MRTFLLIGFSLAADSLAGLAGGLFSDRWLSRYQSALVSFAAGALLAAVFLDVLPEALSSFGSATLTWAFCAFLVFAAIEWVLGHHHHGHTSPLEHAQHEAHRVVPAGLLAADALHNLGDGAAVAAAFLVSAKVGAAAALAIIAHEVPHEVGDYAILRAAGYRKARALWALVAIQLTAFLGAGIMILAAEWVHALVGAVLAIAAGSFLYIGATDLLPEAQMGHGRRERLERMIGFVCGVSLIVAVSLLVH